MKKFLSIFCKLRHSHSRHQDTKSNTPEVTVNDKNFTHQCQGLFASFSRHTSGSYNLQRCVIGYNTGVLQSVIPSIYAILKILKCTSRSISTICHARKSSIFPKNSLPRFFFAFIFNSVSSENIPK